MSSPLPRTATIQFEQLTPSNDRFLHLDLLPDNQVRIDDNETTKFGTFPRDQPFIVQVTLDPLPRTPTSA